MSVIFIALPVTLLLAAGFVFAFVMCARKGQFEDLETPAIRMLFDDDEPTGRRPDREADA
jgi:cbb3-type cytochrome oxidase maturation protein